MTLAVSIAHLQRRCLSAIVSAPLWVVFCVLGGIIFSPIAQGQTYRQGLPAVGNSTPTAAPSQMSIDATQFLTSADDMCAKIAAACAKLSATSTTYPAGATIDARGFTGNQVCKAGNITTMLFECVPQGSSTGAIGGKLLLGNVNLYADGPTAHPWMAHLYVFL